MRTVIIFRHGKARCPICVRTRGRPRLYTSLTLLKEHLFQEHTYNGVYSYIVNQTPNIRGNHRFWILGKCACGCDGLLTYKHFWMPDHPPPYYLSGHDQRLGRPNKGRFSEGHLSWNKDTKGLTGANSTSFKKGISPANDRGGVYIAKNGQVHEWDGGYQPSGPRRYKARSRSVMERVLGRPLLPSEVVFHLDFNSSNDDPGNLEVISRGDLVIRNRDNYLETKPKVAPIYKPKKVKAKKPEKVKTQKPKKIENVPAGTMQPRLQFTPRKTPFCPRCGAFSLPGASCPRC